MAMPLTVDATIAQLWLCPRCGRELTHRHTLDCDAAEPFERWDHFCRTCGSCDDRLRSYRHSRSHDDSAEPARLDRIRKLTARFVRTPIDSPEHSALAELLRIELADT